MHLDLKIGGPQPVAVQLREQQEKVVRTLKCCLMAFAHLPCILAGLLTWSSFHCSPPQWILSRDGNTDSKGYEKLRQASCVCDLGIASGRRARQNYYGLRIQSTFGFRVAAWWRISSLGASQHSSSACQNEPLVNLVLVASETYVLYTAASMYTCSWKAVRVFKGVAGICGFCDFCVGMCWRNFAHFVRLDQLQTLYLLGMFDARRTLTSSGLHIYVS